MRCLEIYLEGFSGLHRSGKSRGFSLGIKVSVDRGDFIRYFRDVDRFRCVSKATFTQNLPLSCVIHGLFTRECKDLDSQIFPL